jgi:hypothetical protein
MRAPTITTNSRAGARARTKGAILALSLAVVLLAATASTASTTPTPLLTLDLRGDYGAIAGPDCRTHVQSCTGRWLSFWVTASNDSKVVLRGDVKRTTVRLRKHAATTSSLSRPFNVKLKHPEQLRGRRVKVKVKGTATDVFGQTASDKAKWVLHRCSPSAEHAGAYGSGDMCDLEY